MKTSNIMQCISNHLKPLALAGAALGLATSAQAVSIAIPNASFEDGANNTTPVNWTSAGGAGGAGSFVEARWQFSAGYDYSMAGPTDGRQVVFLDTRGAGQTVTLKSSNLGTLTSLGLTSLTTLTLEWDARIGDVQGWSKSRIGKTEPGA